MIKVKQEDEVVKTEYGREESSQRKSTEADDNIVDEKRRLKKTLIAKRAKTLAEPGENLSVDSCKRNHIFKTL